MHFVLIVVGDNVEEQLAPFQENNMGDCPEKYLKFWAGRKSSCDRTFFDSEEAAQAALGEDFEPDDSFWENPNRKWDHYCLGGRFAGFLQVKPGSKSEVGVEHQFRENPAPYRADSCLVGDIDFETAEAEVIRQATAAYDQYLSILAGRPEPKTFKEFALDYPTREEALQVYRVDPVVRALCDELLHHPLLIAGVFQGGKEQYVQRALNELFAPVAVVYDGVWYESGIRAWSGPMEKHPGNQPRWNAEFQAFFKSLASNTRITVLDCHI